MMPLATQGPWAGVFTTRLANVLFNAKIRTPEELAAFLSVTEPKSFKVELDRRHKAVGDPYLTCNAGRATWAELAAYRLQTEGKK